MHKSKSYIIEEAKGERGTIRRSWQIRDGPLYDAGNEELKTLHDVFQSSLKKFGNNIWLGVRQLNDDNTAGEYEFKTVADANVEVEKVKGSIAAFGIDPKMRVALYGKNKPEWLIADYACQSRSICSVPLYDTLGPEAAAYVIDHAECSGVFCDWACLENAVLGAEKSGRVKFICVFPLQAFEDYTSMQKDYAETIKKFRGQSIPVLTWGEFLKKTSPVPDVPPGPDDLCTICYTSGTTGVPKGAMLSHRNIMSDCVALNNLVEFQADDRTMSFLPLAHMFERSIQIVNLMEGASACFYRGDTLILLEDIQEGHPTIFIGVPRLYNKIYDKIMAQVEEGGFVKKTLFNWVFERKRAYLKTGSLNSVFDFVFGKVRDALGGKVRLLCTGSAPISGVVMDFLRCCLSAPVIEGYGQTECSCAATCTTLEDTSGGGHVGTPVICNEVCLMSVPDMNYNVDDKINGKIVERGEICFRGPNVFQGYLKMPEKTAETVDKDGWLHSGDIGVWLPSGDLKIIDRKKNIFKLSQGEYVAPEKIENIYLQSKWVAQAFAYGNSLERHLVGIIVPDEDVLAVHCQANNIGGNFSAWCKNDSIRQMIFKNMEAVGKANKLQGFERVKAIYLHDELFAPENGMLTPTFKLKRPVVTKHFQPQIDMLYASTGGKLRSKL